MNSIEKDEIIRDTPLEIKLKEYVKRMNNIGGKEYTKDTFLSKDTIKSSLMTFSSIFGDDDKLDIDLAIIKASIISIDYNLLENILVKNFMSQAYAINLQTFESMSNKLKCISDLNILKAYNQDKEKNKELKK